MRRGFQSTHSLRSATNRVVQWWDTLMVSIHALLAECDLAKHAREDYPLWVSIHALLAECDKPNAVERV